jgi:predicted ATPase
VTTPEAGSKTSAERAGRATGSTPANAGPPLLRVERRAGVGAAGDAFPFSVPAVRTLLALELDAPVTFFVGENGSGKSTMLEAIAAAAGLPTVGGAEVGADDSLAAQRRLARAFKLVWTRRVHRGFFLRAEDFFGFARRMARLRVELNDRLRELDTEYEGRSALAKGLAAGPLRASLAEMTALYGEDLDAHSHGESFLELFQARFVPGGLHLIDEPEAALSPQSQLALIALLKQMIAEGAQFVIATHSPILLAFAPARIYSFDAAPPEQADYDDLPHVTLTRAFLSDPSSFLRRL